MFDNFLVVLVTVIVVASVLVALFLTYRPGVSERTRQTALQVVIAAAIVAGVTQLAVGDTLPGVVLIATAVLAVLLLMAAACLKRLVRRNRARKGEKSAK
ncbi:hypothetical protein [Streptomyces sp. NPDC005538]|uniref:hypothetical protein n=1 Tax=Streptomyces sp. NPDC005538 TaxID=3157043 RepID=UPI0033A83550